MSLTTNDPMLQTICDEIITYIDQIGEAPTITQWAKYFSRSEKTARRRGKWEDIVKLAESQNDLEIELEKEIYDEENTPKKQPSMDLDEVVELMEKVQEIDAKASPKQSYIKIGSTLTSEPIALVFSGDWHLGSKCIDYTRWKNDMYYLLGLPSDRFRLVTCGDLIDNVFPRFKSAEAVFGALSPGNQKIFLENLAERLSPYLDFSCWGNHDNEWDEKSGGGSSVAKILQKHCHYFYGKGYVDYKVGKEVYSIMLSHNLMGSSWFHNLHGQIKEWIRCHSEIIVGAHKHSPGLLRDVQGCYPDGSPRKRYLIQIGTYKTQDDTYSSRYFDRGAIEAPTLVLFPDKHKIVEFETVEDAARYMGVTPKKVKSLKG